MDHASTTAWDVRAADRPWTPAQPIWPYFEHRTQAARSSYLDSSGDGRCDWHRFCGQHYGTRMEFGVAEGPDLTRQQRDAILRRPVALYADKGWLSPCRQIADHLGLWHRTVERAIRQAAVWYGRHTAWKDSGER